MKILCLGNNTVDTDYQTKRLALKNKKKFFGLVNQQSKILEDGYYHTSLYDIDYNEIIDFARKFSQIIVLDQDKNSYNHPNTFYLTIKAAHTIQDYIDVKFLNPSTQNSIKYFEQLVYSNSSFCIFPFIELLARDGNTNLCCRSRTPVVSLNQLGNFKTNGKYVEIRKKMLDGVPVPEYCESCYSLETKGIISARQQETVEWANALNLQTIDDLNQFESPVYYEVRPSNVCNLKCRSCGPEDSNLIFKEYKELSLLPKNYNKPKYTNFDIVNLNFLKKLYVAGGEPTVSIEFLEFLSRCIAENKTNFALQINTNGAKFSEKFKNLINHFAKTEFFFSIDGYKNLNYYMRFPSDWELIIDNAKWVEHNTHKLSFNITVSIYNIAKLNDICKFLENEFPEKVIHCQIAETNGDILSPFIYPSRESVLNSLFDIQKLKCYNNILFKSFIDGLIDYFTRNHKFDKETLKQFFQFNDTLDRSRKVNLADYLPELDSYRNEV